MKKVFEIIKIVKDWVKEDYDRTTTVFSSFSALMNLFFMFFNAFLGLVYSSPWNGSISLYYLLLFIVRSIIIVHMRNGEGEVRQDRFVYLLTHVLLLLMNICLIVPIAMMIEGNRAYRFGLIPAIAMATYTTYRVTMAVRNAVKARKVKSHFTAELRCINFLDAMLSILTLQNALIIATDGMDEDMHTLMIYTSGGIWILIVAVTVLSFMKIKTIEREN